MRYNNILETIGHTPLVKLNKVVKGLKPQVYAKLEYFNPGGSVKDRIGITMIENAEKHGWIKPGGTIIEATSGNTGIGLALMAALKGYRIIFTIQDKQSQEKINQLKAFGAEVIVCPTAVTRSDPRSYYSVARKLSKEIPNSYYPDQYENPQNPTAHYKTTGPEIWEDSEGKITHFVCGVGTGGTITGIAKYLKEKKPKVKIIGVDPIGSILYDFFHTGKVKDPYTYKVEGIGEDFFPATLDFECIDDMIRVGDKDSFIWARRLIREEGIFGGGSAGTALCVAIEVAKKCKTDDFIVVLIPDTGMRYLSKVYNDEWMRENQFIEPALRLTAEDIVITKQFTKGLVYARPEEKVHPTLKKMQHLEVSQMPVFEGTKPVGSVYEDKIMQRLLDGKSLDNLIVREIMDEPFPLVGKNASLEEITRILATRKPAVLVDLGKGKYDIITKYDLLHSMTKIA